MKNAALYPQSSILRQTKTFPLSSLTAFKHADLVFLDHCAWIVAAPVIIQLNLTIKTMAHVGEQGWIEAP